ncbi:MAG: hypothetical protein WC967_09125 [Balneolaceae bacterium]
MSRYICAPYTDPELIFKPALNYISTLPSVGKTKWAIETILNNYSEKKLITIFCAPTKKLLQQVYKDLIKKGMPRSKVHLIMSADTHSTEESSILSFSLSEQFTQEINESKDLGSVYLITHKLYIESSDIFEETKSRCMLIFDEASELNISQYNLKVDKNNEAFMKDYVSGELFLRKQKEIGFKHPVLKPKDILPYMRLTANKKILTEYRAMGDTLFNSNFYELLKRMCDSRYSVYMMENGSQFNFFNFVSPEYAFDGFHEVYLMSAFFEHSELFHILQKNYELINQSHLFNPKRKSKVIKQYKRLQIHSLCEDNSYLSKLRLLGSQILDPELPESCRAKIIKILARGFDKYRKAVESNSTKTYSVNTLYRYYIKELHNRGRTPGSGKKVTKKVQAKITAVTGMRFDELFSPPIIPYFKHAEELVNKFRKTNLTSSNTTDTLIVTNNVTKSTVASYIEYNYPDVNSGMDFMSVKSHGMNNYSHIHIMIFLASLNPQPRLASFLTAFIPEFDYRKQWIAANIAQSVARLSIRDINSKEPCHLIVYSSKVADVLIELLLPYIGYEIKLKKCNHNYKYTTFNSSLNCITEYSDDELKEIYYEKSKKKRDYKDKKQTTDEVFRTHDEYTKVVSNLNSNANKIRRLKKLITKEQTNVKLQKDLDVLTQLNAELALEKIKCKIKIAYEEGYDYQPQLRFIKSIKESDPKFAKKYIGTK